MRAGRAAGRVATAAIPAIPAMLLVALLAACGTSAPTVAPATPPPVPADPTPTAPPTASASRDPSASASGGVTYDETLLAILPSDIDGLTFESQPDAVATVADDPSLALAADRIAFGVVADVESGELAAASVVHLRSNAFGDAFFRAYRDSYDAAACEPAGGRNGNAEADIGGHHTFIGTCAGGAHTYHVYLVTPQAIVSIVAIGSTRRLGERIVEGLRG